MSNPLPPRCHDHSCRICWPEAMGTIALFKHSKADMIEVAEGRAEIVFETQCRCRVQAIDPALWEKHRDGLKTWKLGPD